MKTGAVQIFHEDAQAATVVAMFVGDENTIERIRIFAEQGHSPRQLAGAHASVHQNTSAVCD
jgi:hypothetical protein